MWSGLCEWRSLCQRRCRRTEFLHCDPHTLLFYRRWRPQEAQSLCSCDRMSICSNWKESNINSRTDHYIQMHIHHPVPSCWCSYMTLIYPPHHSTPPPSNSVHTLSTQHLSQTIKSVWMIRIWLVRVSFSNHSVLLSQTEVFMHCDFIQCEPTEIWKR